MAEERTVNVLERAPAAPESASGREYLVPPVDIYETGDAVVVVADMPGVSREKAEVTFENSVLSIGGSGELNGSVGALHKEHPCCEYHRAFHIGVDVDADGITAEMKDGVLRVHLPKSAASRTHRISVRAAS